MRFHFLHKMLFGVAVFGLGVWASMWLEEADRPDPGFAQEWSMAGTVRMPPAGSAKAMSRIFRELKEIRSDVSARPVVDTHPTLQP